MKRTLLAVLLAVGLAGCGEITNTIAPPPGSASQLTLVLDSAPNLNDVGIYQAQALGYFRQADLNVRIITPATGERSLSVLESGRAQVAITSEPEVLLARNAYKPLVSVAALVQAPQITELRCPRTPTSTAASTATTTAQTATTTAQTATTTAHAATTTPKARSKGSAKRSAARPSCHTALSAATYPGAPTYDAQVFSVIEKTIVDQAPLVRRFVQAVARGYQAVRSDRSAAARTLASVAPSRASMKTLEAAIGRALPSLFPGGARGWGLQSATQWNAFGTYLQRRGQITNPNATPDASTNELLAGQGV